MYLMFGIKAASLYSKVGGTGRVMRWGTVPLMTKVPCYFR